MTHDMANHEDNCLLCAVRALTEGVPESWVPQEAGQNVTGVILKMGKVPNRFDLSGEGALFVDLWLGGHRRIRVIAYGSYLRHEIDRMEPQIGDTLGVEFLGERIINDGRYAGRPYKAYIAAIRRGHDSPTNPDAGSDLDTMAQPFEV